MLNLKRGALILVFGTLVVGSFRGCSDREGAETLLKSKGYKIVEHMGSANIYERGENETYGDWFKVIPSKSKDTVEVLVTQDGDKHSTIRVAKTSF